MSSQYYVIDDRLASMITSDDEEFNTLAGHVIGKQRSFKWKYKSTHTVKITFAPAPVSTIEEVLIALKFHLKQTHGYTRPKNRW